MALFYHDYYMLSIPVPEGGRQENDMERIYQSVDQLIGGTPLLQLKNVTGGARILAKLEYLNPAGSVKDRAALYMLNDAEEKGLLKPGGVIIEPTSGNTGIGLAAVAADRGYRCVIVMPDSMSAERIKLMEAYGTQVVLTPGTMSDAIAKAQELAKELPGSFIAGQFKNPANAMAHYCTTGPEIWRDTEGKVDLFLAGVGTGGTITGVGRYLKERNPAVKIVAVEPASSPLLSGGKAGPHGLQGIGANFIPGVLDTSVYDEVIPVTEAQAYAAGRALGRTEGVLVGISAGAALHAAVELANREENAGKNIVVLLPDTGDRYLSTEMFR
jgi:cysteine synthase A